MNEKTIQNGLQKFNYEVFVSKTTLDMMLCDTKQPNIDLYQLIILSESLSNKEIEIITPKLKDTHSIVFRKYLREPLDEKKNNMDSLGIDSWIHSEIEMDVLRELISEYSNEWDTIFTKENDNLHFEPLDQLMIGFTKNQKKCFQVLYDAQSTCISREDLCNYIWNTGKTKSNLAQLSVLIKSLRKKLIKKGFPADIIETIWGKGYILKRYY